KIRNQARAVNRLLYELNEEAKQAGIKGDLVAAEKRNLQVLEMARVLKDDYIVGGALQNQALHYMHSDRNDEAIKFMKESREMLNKLGRLEIEAAEYNSLAEGYLNKHEYEQAIENQFKGLEIFRSLKNKQMIQICLNNLDTLYFMVGKYDEKRLAY